MKKLGKLSISPEKIMKNEELINFKGGYSGICAEQELGCISLPCVAGLTVGTCQTIEFQGLFFCGCVG